MLLDCLMYRLERKIVKIIDEKCVRCELCVDNCQKGAIIVEKSNGKKVKIDVEICSLCGTCLLVCPVSAVTLCVF
ncbi:MAG: 4Fe-4S dicluster domain-containing protein [Crenarchaeota archaeon]|nr:4Fe-4S dicluster domain-containing protein [Thermoproteota archaeon]